MATLNRSIGLRVVPWLALLRVTPNQLTLLGLAAGLIGATRFAEGPSGWLAGALWLQLSFILDNCDGTLARLQHRTSGLGSWLDTLSDCAVNIGLFYGIGVGLQHDTGQMIWQVGGLVTAVGVFFSYAMAFAVQVHRRGFDAWRHPDPPAAAEPDSRLVGFRKRAREDFSWIVLAGALGQHLGWLLWCGLGSSFAIGLVNLRTILRPADDPIVDLNDDQMPFST